MIEDPSTDVVVIGAGAAGLATAIFAARLLGPGRVLLLDGAARPGAKILVSGGGRCNVTNRVVVDRDFSGGPSHLIRRVLRAFTADATVAFFREIGVALHEEEHGKLFPDTHKARTVLDALLVEAGRRGVGLRVGRRVTGVRREPGGFSVTGGAVPLHAGRVALATGGLSLPKTGSDGGGYAMAESLGHTLVPPTPALAPLVLEGDFHQGLSGVAQDVELKLVAAGARPVRVQGALLWTHFGASGPAILDVSRHFLRARLAGRGPRLFANLLPGLGPDAAEGLLLEASRRRARVGALGALEGRLPGSVLQALCREQGITAATPLGQLSRETRKRLVSGLTARELVVRDSRGYNFAEVTAGGVPLEEVDLRTMESRRCPGLYLVGEILDVDGRLGGFNFQWAWSSGFVAAQALAAGREAAIMRPAVAKVATADPE